MAELAALLTHLTNTVLGQFCDAACPLTFHLMQADVPQSFTANFRTKNAQLFSDTALVDLDDLQAWFRPRGDLDHLLDPNHQRKKHRREEEKVKHRRREKKKCDHSASKEDEERKKKRKSSKVGGEHSRMR
ncbi:hypothetical protein C8J57DRAFT_1237803 [Mycena rebaudengoi]|nr:hypothetical protein C8J57DRAFT_1237803 [Mycena rebaudengoi]